jgi:hypothetical protein
VTRVIYVVLSVALGCGPQQHNISKRGDRYLRSLFTTGALAVIRYAKIRGPRHGSWLTALLARRPTKVAAISLANEIARMVWAISAKANATKNRLRLRLERDHAGYPTGCDSWEGEQHVMQSPVAPRCIRRPIMFFSKKKIERERDRVAEFRDAIDCAIAESSIHLGTVVQVLRDRVEALRTQTVFTGARQSAATRQTPHRSYQGVQDVVKCAREDDRLYGGPGATAIAGKFA